MSTVSIDLSAARTLLIGRTPGNDVIVDHPLISRRHAQIDCSSSHWTVTDLGSTNGTYVNGRRVREPMPLAIGDVVDLGACRLVRLDAGRLERRDYRGDTRIEAQDIAIRAGRRVLLEGVSLTLLPSELVGLMGPSGAGKTTLMTALSGYQPPAGGRVLFNGQDLYACFERFRLGIGYVPQDDILHGELTVGEALYFTARLRLPNDTTDAEIARRIDAVLRQLSISHIRHSVIGTPTRKVVSGGERKRVNVAMELLSDPPVLFLDEPTSGLSSEDALSLMVRLRQLARDGRTILLTIHQPSREVFQLLDNLAVVSRDVASADPARLVYYGAAYPEAIRFFNPERKVESEPSPEGVLRGLSERPTMEWHERYRCSAIKKRYVDDRAGHTALTDGSQRDALRPPSVLRQSLMLFRRGITLKTRDVWNSVILFAQAPIIALLLVLVFAGASKDTSGASAIPKDASAATTILFLMNIAALWFGCSNAAREIVAEWAVFSRERVIGLRLPAYLLSKLGLLSVIGLAQCLLLVLIVRHGCRIDVEWPLLLLCLFLSTLVGSSLGLLISAVARSSEVAISLVPLVILPMVVLGGMMQPPHEMEQPARSLAQLVPSRWAFEMSVGMEAKARQTDAARPDLAERFFPRARRSATTTGAAVLVTIALVLMTGTLAVLRSRDVHL